MGDMMNILGLLSNVVGQFGARQQALERANTQLTGGHSQVGTTENEVPTGGFRLPEEVQGWLSERNQAVADRPGGLAGLFSGIGNFISGDKAPEAMGFQITSVDQANELVNEIRKENPALADQLAQSFNEQLGGRQLHYGATDIQGALLDDHATQTEEAEADWQRQLRGMGLLESRGEETLQARRDIAAGMDKIIADSRRAEEDAINSLDYAKAGSLMQLANAIQMRQEVMDNFQDNTTIAMETARGAMNFRHRQDEEALRNRLANDPAFANRPDQIEAQVQNLRHMQRDELFDAAGGMKVQYDLQRSQLDLNTANLQSQAAMAAAGEAVSISGMESGIKQHFADVRTNAEMNRTQVNVSMDLLDRDNKTDMANYLRDMTKTVVPFAPVLQMAMGLDIAIEDRANALKWGSEAEANSFFGGLGQTLMGFGALQDQQSAAEAQGPSQGASIGAGAASGAMAGAAGGPIGMLIGAGVGAAGGYASSQ